MKPVRVALVTGGVRGIGRVIATDLAADHGVAVSHREPVADDLGDLAPFQADFADPAAPRRLVHAVLDRFGRIDVIVNNAATLADGPEAMQVNALAPMALVEAAAPHLDEGSAIVNISSGNARLPAMSAPHYSASKAALETWTRWAAKTLGPNGIRVNAVAPGAVESAHAPRPPELVAHFVEQTALGRLAEARDIAAAVRFLASDAARAITGEVLGVSGGYRL